MSRIGRLVLKLHLPAGLDERHRTGVERAIKSCPAYGTLLHPPSVEISIERPAVAQADEISGNHRHKVVG